MKNIFEISTKISVRPFMIKSGISLCPTDVGGGLRQRCFLEFGIRNRS